VPPLVLCLRARTWEALPLGDGPLSLPVGLSGKRTAGQQREGSRGEGGGAVLTGEAAQGSKAQTRRLTREKG
jgi:hypothetical protein